MGWYQRILNNSGLQALYDPSDLTSLYQSRTGGDTGAVDSVVGIMLDKSEMGGKTAANFIAGQSDLLGGVGAFASATGWAVGAGWSITGDAAVASATSATLSYAVTVAANAWYQVTFDVAAYTSGTLYVDIGGGTGATTASAGTKTLMLYSGAASLQNIRFYGGTIAATIDNVSVKAIPGYHALAPSDAARPILRAGYLDTDGVDDWMNVFPTLDLGQQWWHVGGWKADSTGDSYFSTTQANGVSGPYVKSGATLPTWWNAANTAYTPITTSGDYTAPHVITVERASASSLSARMNGAGGLTIAPFDDTAQTEDLALFSADANAASALLDGRFYGGAFGTGTLTSTDRALLERYVAGLTGVSL